MFEGDSTITKAKRDYSVLPPAAELIGGGSPDALRVSMLTSAKVPVARSGADTPDPNCFHSGWAANGTTEQAIHPEDVTMPIGIDKECKAKGTWKTGWTVACKGWRDHPITFPGGSGTMGDRWSLRLEITP